MPQPRFGLAASLNVSVYSPASGAVNVCSMLAAFWSQQTYFPSMGVFATQVLLFTVRPHDVVPLHPVGWNPPTVK